MEVSLLSNEKGFNLSWGAVVAGVVTALSTEVMLNFLGIGLGITSFDLSADSLFKTGLRSIIWLTLSGVITTGLGGLIAGIFSNSLSGKTRMLHGLLTWSFVTLITIATTATLAGTMMGSTTNAFKNITSNISPKVAYVTGKLAYSSVSGDDSNQNVAEREETINEATNSLGAVSIMMFIAFLLNALASVAGSFWSIPKKE